MHTYTHTHESRRIDFCGGFQQNKRTKKKDFVSEQTVCFCVSSESPLCEIRSDFESIRMSRSRRFTCTKDELIIMRIWVKRYCHSITSRQTCARVYASADNDNNFVKLPRNDQSPSTNTAQLWNALILCHIKLLQLNAFFCSTDDSNLECWAIYFCWRIEMPHNEVRATATKRR